MYINTIIKSREDTSGDFSSGVGSNTNANTDNVTSDISKINDNRNRDISGGMQGKKTHREAMPWWASTRAKGPSPRGYVNCDA